MSIIDPLATPVAAVLEGLHRALSTVLPEAGGWAWGLSIVFLTITVRLVLLPLALQQARSMRRMAELSPRIRELQQRHKGDRETAQAELLKLYRENGANPLGGCLPMLVQLPVFFALFSVINEFRPGRAARFGLTADQLEEGGRAQVFGAPIASAFTSSSDLLAQLGGDGTTVRVVAVVMILLMGASTFWTQRQMIRRVGPSSDPQQRQIQKLMLYVFPIGAAVFGFAFPIGVLLYWLTTNVWSMGQHQLIASRMPTPPP